MIFLSLKFNTKKKKVLYKYDNWINDRLGGIWVVYFPKYCRSSALHYLFDPLIIYSLHPMFLGILPSHLPISFSRFYISAFPTPLSVNIKEQVFFTQNILVKEHKSHITCNNVYIKQNFWWDLIYRKIENISVYIGE